MRQHTDHPWHSRYCRTSLFSGDCGPAVSAELHAPREVALGRAGELYICDAANHRVRKVTADGKICTVAGTGTKGSTV
ncbi:hypothetical protein [Streptomyces melanogenes]|uniref:hypothetical protein n=1 Tax=Streptomyces melanogenes TaxID=67326 RepID=UPI003787AF8D